NSVTITSFPVNACVGDVVVINTNAVIGATGYTWSVDAGTLVNGNAGPYTTTLPTATLTLGAVPANGSGWEVCVSASNACGVTNTNCRNIRGALSTPSSIVGSSYACPSSAGSYSTGAVAGATGYSWSITGDASVTGTGTTGSVTFGPAFTTGTLCVRAVLPCGYQSAQRCMSITNSVGFIGTISGTFAVCPGQNGVVYSVPAVANAASYAWTVPANISIVSGQGTNSISVNVGAGFNVGNICLTATSNCGVVSAPRCKTVASQKPVTPGNVSGAATGICGATITHSVPAVAGATSYTWTAPVGATIVAGQGTNTVDISYTNSFTTGQLCVTSNNTCGSSTARCINVKGAPANPGVISGPTTVCAAEQGLVYSVPAVFGASSYNWTLPAGATIVAGANTNSIVVDWGNASGSVIVSTTNGCGTSGARTLSVLVNCKVAGNALNQTLVSVNPNPASEKITIQMPVLTEGTYYIKLTDLTGRESVVSVMNNNELESGFVLDVSALAKGVYILTISSDAVNLANEKIVIQ
ncbi:MAG: T9SS type A sorting domain-containing protein, partial [Bacteroidia bacterium]|nr:T9SS type A sorting domain-containing protein [Bacteroidia bacterium]